ncbi:DUF6478 family protein [Tropicimonas marinistellae]|uniref:DUF6478 family protein n=1 Tax=Tropicimonas marinistellae TaxID=1739787 RepID=UPI000834D426|nr:DUF6478 family protein [Tropicimonas marinistellae]
MMSNTLARPRARRPRSSLGRLLARWPATETGRSAASLLAHAGISGFELPHTAEWAWRPNPWALPVMEGPVTFRESGTRVSADATLYHDASAIEANLRQSPSAAAPESAAPFELDVDVRHFDGTFLSMVLECPPAGIAGIRRRDLVGVSVGLDQDPSATIFLRYNLRHGPNTETIPRELPPADPETGRVTVEFDLAYVEINEKRVEAAWLDVILQSPAGTHTTLCDLVMYRRPRAEL